MMSAAVSHPEFNNSAAGQLWPHKANQATTEREKRLINGRPAHVRAKQTLHSQLAKVLMNHRANSLQLAARELPANCKSQSIFLARAAPKRGHLLSFSPPPPPPPPRSSSFRAFRRKLLALGADSGLQAAGERPVADHKRRPMIEPSSGNCISCFAILPLEEFANFSRTERVLPGKLVERHSSPTFCAPSASSASKRQRQAPRAVSPTCWTGEHWQVSLFSLAPSCLSSVPS